jgi:hypothetical protein
MGRKASWPPKTTVSLRFEQETIYYIDHLIKYLNAKQGMMGTRKITRSVVVEQAIAMYFKEKRNQYFSTNPDKLK